MKKTKLSELKTGDQFRTAENHFPRVLTKVTNKGYHCRFKQENQFGKSFFPEDREVFYNYELNNQKICLDEYLQ